MTGVQCSIWAVSALMWFGLSILDANTHNTIYVEIAWWCCVAFEILVFYGLGKQRSRLALPHYPVCMAYVSNRLLRQI